MHSNIYTFIYPPLCIAIRKYINFILSPVISSSIENSKEDVHLSLQDEMDASQELSLYQEVDALKKAESDVDKNISEGLKEKEDQVNQLDETKDLEGCDVASSSNDGLTLREATLLLDEVISRVSAGATENSLDSTIKADGQNSESSKSSSHQSNATLQEVDANTDAPCVQISEERFGEVDVRASESATMFDDSLVEQNNKSANIQGKRNTSLMFTDDEQRMDVGIFFSLLNINLELFNISFIYCIAT